MTTITQSQKPLESSYSLQGHYGKSRQENQIMANSRNTDSYFSNIQGQQVGLFGGGLDNTQVFPQTSNGQYYSKNISPMVQGAQETYEAIGPVSDKKK